jgi:hypothetical protein
METSERTEGPTPNNGAYAIAYYQDIDGTPVPKSQALRAEVVEYSAQGKPVAITFIDLVSDDSEDEE